MKLIVGLGNPGFRYRNTRHNAGFLVVKEISKRFRIPVKKRKYKGLLGRGPVETGEVSLFMPQSYMNLSGQGVRELASKNRIKPHQILVVCDDINLKFGFIRLKKRGSAGGHKGLESIIEHLGTNAFPRLRIGVGRRHKADNLAEFVLGPFDFNERSLLKDVISRAVECVLMCLREGPEKAMTMFNKRQFP